MDLREFGLYFTKLREKSGYKSQRELAEKSGVSHSTINRIEAGTHKVSIENLRILSKFLKGVEFEDLMRAAGYLDADRDKPSRIVDDSDDDDMEHFFFSDGGENWTEEEIEIAREAARKAAKLAAQAAVDAYRHGKKNK